MAECHVEIIDCWCVFCCCC